jgi:hypothetical protein
LLVDQTAARFFLDELFNQMIFIKKQKKVPVELDMSKGHN